MRDGKGPIAALRARAVLVDMEEGVVNSALGGPMRDVFDPVQTVTSVSGSGNNWAVGNLHYGARYRDALAETVRQAAERCDCLQSFVTVHSMGGGTGSGLGTAILSLLRDEYPGVYRFVTAVFPSADDDVVTSPYNAMLALRELNEHADCVLPIENQQLAEICLRINAGARKPNSAITEAAGTKLPWDAMNNLVAQMLLHMTASARFEGALNVDVNELTMNLVPFPGLHYLIPSLSPLYALADVALPPRALDQMFTDAVSPEYQLVKADPKRGTYLAVALLVRGGVEISDVRRNIARLRPQLNFVDWNREGWKTGLCDTPGIGQPHSLLALSNNTCFAGTLGGLRDRFVKLYRSKAYVHHFTSEGMDGDFFTRALESCTSLIAKYEELGRRPALQRLRARDSNSCSLTESHREAPTLYAWRPHTRTLTILEDTSSTDGVMTVLSSW